MDRLKKIGFGIVFFLTISQVIGNSIFQFDKKLFVVENHENEQAANETISLEFDQQDDECSVKLYTPCIFASTIKENISIKACCFNSFVYFAFWQPPQKS